MESAARTSDEGQEASRASVLGLILPSAMTSLIVLTLGFLVFALLISPAQHGRNQTALFGELREQLAAGVAPVSGIDQAGAPLPPGTPMAVLEIRVLGLREAVVEGTTGSNLAVGVGHRRDTLFPGQAGVSVLMGRQAAYGGPLGRLGELRRGDEITVTTGQGVSTYAVAAVRRAGDPLPNKADFPGRLTLISATGTPWLPTDAIRVDAKLVSQPFATTSPSVSRVLPAEEPMANDTSRMIVLVLWCQGLLLAVLAFTWLRLRWGSWRTWVVAVPVLLFFGLAVASELMNLLPNLT